MFPFTAQYVRDKHALDFPQIFRKKQDESTEDNRFVIYDLSMTHSDVKYVRSLGFDVIHFNPMVPFSYEQIIYLHKIGILTNSSIRYRWTSGFDFYVIFISDFYMDRSQSAAVKVQKLWRGFLGRHVALVRHMTRPAWDSPSSEPRNRVVVPQPLHFKDLKDFKQCMPCCKNMENEDATTKAWAEAMGPTEAEAQEASDYSTDFEDDKELEICQNKVQNWVDSNKPLLEVNDVSDQDDSDNTNVVSKKTDEPFENSKPDSGYNGEEDSDEDSSDSGWGDTLDKELVKRLVKSKSLDNILNGKRENDKTVKPKKWWFDPFTD